MRDKFIELFEDDGESRGLFRKELIYRIEIPGSKTKWVAVYIFSYRNKMTYTEKLFIHRETYEALFNSSETN